MFCPDCKYLKRVFTGLEKVTLWQALGIPFEGFILKHLNGFLKFNQNLFYIIHIQKHFKPGYDLEILFSALILKHFKPGYDLEIFFPGWSWNILNLILMFKYFECFYADIFNSSCSKVTLWQALEIPFNRFILFFLKIQILESVECFYADIYSILHAPNVLLKVATQQRC